MPNRGRLLVEVLAPGVHAVINRLRKLLWMKRAVFLETSIVNRVPSAVIDFEDLLRKEVSIRDIPKIYPYGANIRWIPKISPLLLAPTLNTFISLPPPPKNPP